MATNQKVLVMQHLEPRARAICPYCGSKQVWQARQRGIIERHLFRFFHLSPHQCPECDKRFYARVSGPASKTETGK